MWITSLKTCAFRREKRPGNRNDPVNPESRDAPAGPDRTALIVVVRARKEDQEVAGQVDIVAKGEVDVKASEEDLSHREARVGARAEVGGKARVRGAKPTELRVEPTELSYKAIGGLKGVNVINDTQDRKFFKVKCSDNMLYRVNPVFGSVEPGRSARIDILRQNGGAKIDKIVLVTTKAEEGEVPCREVFNQARETEMMVLPLLVQE
ncbi:hypothetical protein RB195_003180 [Necator americanus]|uniref:Major sperm protein n=1 Tax=Necator americanus TaxID=51031 RepID=A0ABR1DMZ2_NECAM